MSFTLLNSCRDYLDNVASVDIYFAKTMMERVPVPSAMQADWFHLALALSWHQRQGHSCLYLPAIANQLMFASQESVKAGWQFPSLEQLQHLASEVTSSEQTPALLVFEQDNLFTQRYWQFEQDIKQGISVRTSPVALSKESVDAVQGLWPCMFSTENNLEDWQQFATAAALHLPFAIISGGPGTGKTYTVARLLLALQAAYGGALRIKLAAPTGKAAQRLTESVGNALRELSLPDNYENVRQSVPTEAQTLHRLLGVKAQGVDCYANQQNPLDCDVLIVDESSMVDVALMARLFRALTPSTRLFLIGDPDQLPSVESGNVLASLVGANKRHYSAPLLHNIAQLCPHLNTLSPSEPARDFRLQLSKSQRFSGALADCAAAIQQGEGEQAWAVMNRLSHQQVMPNNAGVYWSDLSEAKSHFRTLARQWFANVLKSQSVQEAMAALAHCRWLTPMRKGPYGVGQLNREVEQALSSLDGQIGRVKYYRGRPVMVTSNHYAQKLFNGDVGIIWPDNQGQLKAWFEDGEGGYRGISLARLPEVETVFAMTIHKSQGSEFQHVLLLIPPVQAGNSGNLCTRELIYTGLTRAKQSASLLTEYSRFKDVVHTQQQRFSGLTV